MNEENRHSARLTEDERKFIQYLRNLDEDKKLILIKNIKDCNTYDEYEVE